MGLPDRRYRGRISRSPCKLHYTRFSHISIGSCFSPGFYPKSSSWDLDDVVNFAIRFLLLGTTAKALDMIPAVGPYFSGFFGGVFSFLMPVGLTLLFMYFWKKYFSSMM